MEGCERAKFAFQSWGITKFWFWIFPCCMTIKRKQKCFRGVQLDVEKGVEPELLIWENFGVSKFSKFFRLIFFIIFIIGMLVTCFKTIVALGNLTGEVSKQVPDIQCPKEIDSKSANLDFMVAVNVRNGDFHCFCKNLLSKIPVSELMSFKFPLDGMTHCSEWYLSYLIKIASTIGITATIITANTIIVFIMSYGN